MRISTTDRRSRLGWRHALSAKVEDAAAAATAVVGLHATDPCTVFMSVRARARRSSVAQIEHALYEQRVLVRMLGMRRTMFVVPLDAVEIVHESSTRQIAERERRRTEKFLADGGSVADPAAWFAHLCEATVSALPAEGGTTAELTPLVPGLDSRIPVGTGTANATTMSVASRVLFQLAAEGHLVRGRPRGSWQSSQYRWTPLDRWADIPRRGLDAVAARAELVHRYLQAFGPATEADVVWWTGWTKTAARAAIAEVGAVAVDTDDGPGYVLPGDLEREDGPGEWVALLPSLDATTMGWKERRWYLGDHAGRLFDRNGNAGPTVWVNGRVVGGWAQEPSGEVVWRLLEDIGADATQAVAAEAAVVTEWLDGAVVMPRFPTPLQRELAAG